MPTSASTKSPQRFDISYIDAESSRQRPVMLHHAVLGSLERFIGVLLEHHGGHLPLWLAPEQIVVASITSDMADEVRRRVDQLDAEGLRAVADVRDERISRKVADAWAAGIPVILAIGKSERSAGTVSVRIGDAKPRSMTVPALISALRDDAFR